ncbi:MAG: ribosomal protein S18-alanine N-acetyltransferase [candidate division WOR-3 bacterium]|nr:ribosomal protein S18-alanine N-acetyltransferase [candidate division WOR-3 bacterium]
MQIEPMTLEDLDQVMAIEKSCFVSPWKRSFFEYDICRKEAQCFVAKEKDKVIGYVDAWFIADEVHLANIAVAQEFRRQGIASQLLAKIIEIAQKKNCKKIFLEVRLSNIIAQKFYEKFGFRRIYQRKKYYPDGEDALIYEKVL